MAHVCKTNQIEVNLLTEDQFTKMGDLYMMFKDPTRLKIMYLLLNNQLVSVCDIASALKMTHSAISHQLSLLRKSNLVKAKKAGKEVYYCLADDHIASIFKTALEHISE